MSDRALLIQQPTGERERSVALFMDGDSGTWRLFLYPDHTCIDFSLAGLRTFHVELGKVIQDIESDPEAYNAEVRRGWRIDE
jgi:hypothetical protein